LLRVGLVDANVTVVAAAVAIPILLCRVRLLGAVVAGVSMAVGIAIELLDVRSIRTVVGRVVHAVLVFVDDAGPHRQPLIGHGQAVGAIRLGELHRLAVELEHRPDVVDHVSQYSPELLK
jgi:hypothetical protein